MRSSVKWSLFLVALAALPLVGGCGGGGDSPATCAPATQDVTGQWSITEFSNSAGCGQESDSYTLDAIQVGSNITVTDTNGRNYTGFMCGDRVEAHTPFSYPEDGGTTTVTNLVFTVVGNNLSGSSSWSWSDGFESCSGTTTFTGVR